MPKRRKRKISITPDRELTFGSILDEVSFRPLGRRIKVKQGISHAGLRMSRKTEGATGLKRDDVNGQ